MRSAPELRPDACMRGVFRCYRAARPAGPAPDPGLPVCPGVRLLVVSKAEYESSVVPMKLANASFPYGQWELADLSGTGRHSLPTSPLTNHHSRAVIEAELE